MSYPVTVYVFQGDECRDVQTIGDEGQALIIPLTEGTYSVYAIGGASDDNYVLPDASDALTSSAIALREGHEHSDLMAAARALCQHEAGMACILGTGANSCLYDGEKIVQNTPALGYILGDEGSGSVLGRMFLNAIFKNPLFADIRDEFLQANKMTQADIIRKVYREPMANRWLASLSPFIHDHLAVPVVRQLVVDNFCEFFRKNLRPYQRLDLPVHFVGSMAHHFSKQLEEAAQEEGFIMGNILQSPIEGLLEYHQ